MLRPIGTNISVITNFGCRANCWYCVWKDHPLRDIRLETDWLQLESFLVEHRHKGKMSVSGGGDCLYRYPTYADWWKRLFDLCAVLDLKVDVHSREPFYREDFWRMVNRVVVSSDRLADDIDYLSWLVTRTKLRIVHVVTAETTDALIDRYLEFQLWAGCQFTLKQLTGYDDNGNYHRLCEKYPDVFRLDEGDYNLYYMPDNTITDNFMLKDLGFNDVLRTK